MSVGEVEEGRWRMGGRGNWWSESVILVVLGIEGYVEVEVEGQVEVWL